MKLLFHAPDTANGGARGAHYGGGGDVQAAGGRQAVAAAAPPLARRCLPTMAPLRCRCTHQSFDCGGGQHRL